MDIKNFIKSKYNRVSLLESNILSQMNTYLGWYRGTNDFYTYRIYNGIKHIKFKRKTLNMCKKACEDWANLLLNEKCSIAVNENQEALNKVLDASFLGNANISIEKAFALGAGAFVIVKYNDNICINFVDGNRCHPLDSNTRECAFEAEIMQDGKKVTVLSIHLVENGNYIVYNHAFNENGKEVPLNGIESAYPAGKYPLFAFIRPQSVNKNNFNTPFGEACFSNAVDVNKSIDLIFDSLCNEFTLGKKRIFASTEAVNYMGDSEGDMVAVFDPDDVVIHLLPERMEGSNIIKEVNMTLRSEDHERALQLCLNLFSNNCGFGDKHYRWGGGTVQTATQVISENSEMFRNIKKQEIMLEKALKKITQAVLYLLGLNPETKIIVNFDDSVIEDKNAEMQRDLQLVMAGMMKGWEFRVKHMGDSEDKAKKILQDIFFEDDE